MTLEIDLWSPHTHACAYTHRHRHRHTHTHTDTYTQTHTHTHTHRVGTQEAYISVLTAIDAIQLDT